MSDVDAWLRLILGRVLYQMIFRDVHAYHLVGISFPVFLFPVFFPAFSCLFTSFHGSQ